MANGEGPNGGEETGFSGAELNLAPTLQALEQSYIDEISGVDTSIQPDKEALVAPEKPATPETPLSKESIDRADDLISIQADVFATRRALQLDALRNNDFDVVAAADRALIKIGAKQETPPATVHSVQVSGHPKVYHPTGQEAPKPVDTPATDEAKPETDESRQTLGIPWNTEWERIFPDGESTVPLEDRQQAYREFLGQLPPTMIANVAYLREVRRSESDLKADPDVTRAMDVLKQSDREIRHMAAAVVRAERLDEDIIEKHILRNAEFRRMHGDSAELPQGERDLMERENRISQSYRAEVRDLKLKPGVGDELERLHHMEQAHQLRRGYMETETGRKIIKAALGPLVAGKPMLLFGETGGAKTALAEHIATLLAELNPRAREQTPGAKVTKPYEIISLHESITTNDIMGRIGLDNGGEGSTVTVFHNGPLARAMDEGMPIILDELDMAAVGGLGRLHQIMQLHPGDSVLIQEDTGKVITIKEGFVIMATANLASSRYERNRLDPALYQRFQRGAGVHPVPYPDHLIDVGGYPKENMELAIAQLTRKDGSAEIPAGFAPAGSSADRLKVFYKFVQAAQHTQRLFTEPVSDADSVGKSIVSSSEYQSRKPVLKESVISPRIVLAVIERLQQNPNLELTEMLAQQVSGYASDSDRIIIAKILASYGLLEGVSERELRVPTGSLEGLQAAA